VDLITASALNLYSQGIDPDDRLQRYRRDQADGRVLQQDRRARAPPLCRRPCSTPRSLRVAPGTRSRRASDHLDLLAGAGRQAGPPRCRGRWPLTCRSTPRDVGRVLRGGHPGQLTGPARAAWAYIMKNRPPPSTCPRRLPDRVQSRDPAATLTTRAARWAAPLMWQIFAAEYLDERAVRCSSASARPSDEGTEADLRDGGRAFGVEACAHRAWAMGPNRGVLPGRCRRSTWGLGGVPRAPCSTTPSTRLPGGPGRPRAAAYLEDRGRRPGCLWGVGDQRVDRARVRCARFMRARLNRAARDGSPRRLTPRPGAAGMRPQSPGGPARAAGAGFRRWAGGGSPRRPPGRTGRAWPRRSSCR